MDSEKEKLSQVLILGYEIRRRCEMAPFFGPRADAEVEGKLWPEITKLRDELETLVHAIAGDTPDVWPMIKLEVEGCGENYHHQRSAFEKNWAGNDTEKAQHLQAILKEALGVMASRIEAIRGHKDPDHGVGGREA